MSTREVWNNKLEPGMVLALPMGRTATIKNVRVGIRYVHIDTEHGRSRLFADAQSPVIIQSDHPNEMTKAEALEVIAQAFNEYIEASRKMRSKVTIEDFARWLEGYGDGSEVEI